MMISSTDISFAVALHREKCIELQFGLSGQLIFDFLNFIKLKQYIS